jgi:hypothetical protein
MGEPERTLHDATDAPATELPMFGYSIAYPCAEVQALKPVCNRYQTGERPVHEVLSAQELARLHFVRWLYQTGRLVA